MFNKDLNSRVIPKLGINTLNLGPSLRQLNSLQVKLYSHFIFSELPARRGGGVIFDDLRKKMKQWDIKRQFFYSL